MRTKMVTGQPFFAEWQYRQACETCGLPGLHVCAVAEMPSRLRLHCSRCQVITWHRLSNLPEAFK